MKKILLIFFMIFLWACQKQGENMQTHSRQVINCAHRGASGHAPENTLAAVRVAMGMEAQMAEIDIQQTADDRLVLLHDDELNRTTNGEGFLWQKNYDELKRLDAGSWFDAKFAGEPLPTLEEVIALARGKIKLNIEVKLHGHERNIAKLVVDTIRRENFQQECIVTCFGHAVADEIKKLAPELQVGYIFGTEEYHEGVFSGGADLLSANHRLISPEFMQKARAANKQVHVWTVNDTLLMQRMLDFGVDAIITNYPDQLAEVMRKL
jgi:glycerophosphoryl diester phosphodiesterase